MLLSSVREDYNLFVMIPHSSPPFILLAFSFNYQQGSEQGHDILSIYEDIGLEIYN